MIESRQTYPAAISRPRTVFVLCAGFSHVSMLWELTQAREESSDRAIRTLRLRRLFEADVVVVVSIAAASRAAFTAARTPVEWMSRGCVLSILPAQPSLGNSENCSDDSDQVVVGRARVRRWKLPRSGTMSRRKQ